MHISPPVMIAVLIACYIWYWFLAQKFAESKQRYASNGFTMLITGYSVTMLSLIFKEIFMERGIEEIVSLSLATTVTSVVIIHVLLEKKYLNSTRNTPDVLRGTTAEIGTTAMITTTTQKQVTIERYVFSKKGWVLLSAGIEDREITDTPENTSHQASLEQTRFDALPKNGIRHG